MTTFVALNFEATNQHRISVFSITLLLIKNGIIVKILRINKTKFQHFKPSNFYFKIKKILTACLLEL